MRYDSFLDLADWRRRVFDLYRRAREESDPEEAWDGWCRGRDHLFRTHDQSPLPSDRRNGFEGIDYFPYDPGFRVSGTLRDLPPTRYDIATSGEGTIGFTRFAVVGFVLESRALELELYWLEGYGGGIYLPFRDATSGRDTYGGGRYLLDTVKGADLGADGDRLVLDFNFAYNPSCSYDPRWVCPLAPPANRLDVAIEAGERGP